MAAVSDRAWHAAIVDLLRRVRLAQPDELAGEINTATRPLALEVTIYLIDHEQLRLRAMPERGKPTPPPLTVHGTLAGRAFTTIRPLAAGDDDGAYRLWIPMVDGAERLGVAEVIAHEAPADPARFERHAVDLVGLLGHLITVKMPYGDGLQQVRRTQAMSPAGELLLSLLPPLTFSCRRATVSAILEPCYDVGGDAYDYAADGAVIKLAVLDAMGRGLTAGLTCAAALSAIRAARRDGHGLYALARAADAALTQQFPDLRFVTGVLAELDMDTGKLRYINAGHPAPLLLRHGKAVRALAGGRRMPMGIDDSTIEVGEEMLEPDDRLLLYTDGVVEAPGAGGDRFGVPRLVDLAERCAADALPGPETLRRLARAAISHQDGPPADDATLLLMDWSGAAAERTQP
ncbi:PP2C family protein-serine/threonine phosphatase [Asanoa sp. WMMD1127]|uniref:PP2C family protein-serine/threonine phosphatase n=1 Tax=Asanoa sp. WMMD1127 TaxID=3016107 RepID=UPI002417C31C|nr:PP2C family protein-serine/threonine phosphatase [Asanoa sp. WMMD1127]MDG4826173.1 PP2C family protein-serine/threonine phosphatase [Asanoa sp. WMMD1127]